MKKNMKKVLAVLAAIAVFSSAYIFLRLLIKAPVSTLLTAGNETETAYSTRVLKVPAVDQNKNGVMVSLIVKGIKGEGRVLVDINQLLFWIDTQHSIRTARDVAQNVIGYNTSEVDLIYTIETNASVIGGPSAGAALTVATIAVLQNKSLNPYVTITGTINEDGSIGSVGEILAKAKASKEAGMKIFLVPSGQGVQPAYKQVKECKEYGFGHSKITYCEIVSKTEEVNIGKEVGIEVIEVSTIEDALKYFLD